MFKDMTNESSKIRQILCADMPFSLTQSHINIIVVIPTYLFTVRRCQ